MQEIIACPSCQAKIDISTAGFIPIGTKLRCKECKHIFKLPGPPEVLPPPLPRGVAAWSWWSENTTGELICKRCGCVGPGKWVTPGSFVVELALWILFCAPGLIYTLWRLTAGYRGCRFCGSPEVISIHSPLGKQLCDQVTKKT